MKHLNEYRWKISAFFCLLVSIQNCKSWDYTPDQFAKWAEESGDCIGELQSPIELSNTNSMYLKQLKPIQILSTETGKPTTAFEVAKAKTTVTIKPKAKTWVVQSIGDKDTKYLIESIDFHFASDSANASEHQIDGQQASMELHIYCYNSMYASWTEAAGQPDGLVALAILANEAEASKSSKTLIGSLGGFIGALGSTLPTEITTFDLGQLLDHVNICRYFRYFGSLTTPPCSPNVMWTVFSDIATVTKEELDALRNLNLKFGAKTNARPLQPLNNAMIMTPRMVYKSYG